MARKQPTTSGSHELHHLHVSPTDVAALTEQGHHHGPLTAAHDLHDLHGKSHIAQTQTAKDVITVKLSEVNIGQWCRIHQIHGEGALRHRLLDMGLTPRTRVLLRHTAPMGDPMEFYLRGYSLSLRKEDAAEISVVIEKGEVAKV